MDKGLTCRNCLKLFYPSHFNEKYCSECKPLRYKNRHMPLNLTESDIDFIEENAGLMPINDIADCLNVHRSTIKRAGNALGLSFAIKVYSEELVRELLEYYKTHTRAETQKKYPGVRVRSIVERTPLKEYYKQVRFTDEQAFLILRMGGLVRKKVIAKYLDRPNAYEGSIKSFFVKRGLTAKTINGLYKNKAHYIAPGCPSIEVNFYNDCKICLYVDMAKHLRPRLDKPVIDAINTMAHFQTWLWGGGNVKAKIKYWIKKLEENYNGPNSK